MRKKKVEVIARDELIEKITRYFDDKIRAPVEEDNVKKINDILDDYNEVRKIVEDMEVVMI